MKRAVIILIGLVTILTIWILIIINNNDKYLKDIIKGIHKNYNKSIDIDNIYKYNDYVIVENENDVLVLDSNFNEIMKETKTNLAKKEKDYEIIFNNNKIEYLDKKITKSKVIYTYYDSKTLSLNDKIIIGG